MTSVEGWVALVTLTVLEIVLGIDNIIFISILAGRLPVGDRARARRLGLSLAMFIRIALLLSITWVMGLTEPLITIGRDISGRDLILIVGWALPAGEEHPRDSREARRRRRGGRCRAWHRRLHQRDHPDPAA
jgi:predicted tellurium resistance membrane protein TerC